MPRTLAEIAAAVGGIAEGDPDVLVEGVAGLEDASAGDIVFVENARSAARAAESPAAAVIAPPDIAVAGKPVVRAPQPRLAFVRVLDLFRVPEHYPQGIAETARIGARATYGRNVSIGDFCSIGDDVTLGDNVVLFPFVYLGDNVRVGPDTVLFPHVTVYHDAEIGARVRIHSCSVIGADGFGYVPVDRHHSKIPHLGRVVIEDDVELGACVCVDRAKTAETRIGRGTKVDNLVQIAHNVHIGEHCLIVAQTGIAGSATLGDYVVAAGQVGINAHVHIGSGTRIGGQSGVFGDVAPGSTVSGHPAREHREHLRILAATQRLPELLQTVRELRQRVEELERKLGEGQPEHSGA